MGVLTTDIIYILLCGTVEAGVAIYRYEAVGNEVVSESHDKVAATTDDCLDMATGGCA